MKPFLDESKINRFRELINSSPIFYRDEKHANNWNLICVFMDRINDSIKSLTAHDFLAEDTRSTDNLILFIVHTDIIVESINKLFDKLGIDNPLKDKSDIFNQLGDGRGTDNKFFKHLRALSYAHSIETAHASPYVKKGETQYSPYIMNHSLFQENHITISVYSSIEENDMNTIRFPKLQLIRFVESRYNLVDYLNDYLQEEVTNHNDQQISDVIEISEDPIQTLSNLKQAAVRRYDDSLINYIDEIIYTLNYQTSNEKNQNAVDKLKDFIIPAISEFIALYQIMDDSHYNHVFMSALSFQWKTDIPKAHYMLEKIRLYLIEEYGPNVYNFDQSSPYDPNTESNVEWGFQQLKIFKSVLADDYVEIDYHMPFKEIQLLVSAVLYLNHVAKKG